MLNNSSSDQSTIWRIHNVTKIIRVRHYLIGLKLFILLSWSFDAVDQYEMSVSELIADILLRETFCFAD
jgi:hypothetical protein